MDSIMYAPVAGTMSDEELATLLTTGGVAVPQQAEEPCVTPASRTRRLGPAPVNEMSPGRQPRQMGAPKQFAIPTITTNANAMAQCWTSPLVQGGEFQTKRVRTETAVTEPAPTYNRFGLATFDPRMLLPTRKNLDMVANLSHHVYAQLQEDDMRVSRFPESRSARHALRESLEYLKILNNFVAQGARGTVSTEPAVKAELLVETSPYSLPQALECIYTEKITYVRVKSIRDSIYGCVELYQVGSCGAAGQPIKLSNPAQWVAIKAFEKDRVLQRKSRTGHSVQEDPLRELAIQQRLSHPGHPNVIQLLSVMETETTLYAAYPYLGKDMFDYIAERKRVSEAEAKQLFRGMLQAVHYCHQMGICHRDISLENFMIREVSLPNGETKLEPVLIDFGLSYVMQRDDEAEEWRPVEHTGAVGKEFYMAPEVFTQTSMSYHGPKTDVWSLGICLAIMLTGFPLWGCPSNMDERFKVLILQRRLAEVLQEWKFTFSSKLVNLLEGMLELDVERRITLTDVFANDWLNLP